SGPRAVPRHPSPSRSLSWSLGGCWLLVVGCQAVVRVRRRRRQGGRRGDEQRAAAGSPLVPPVPHDDEQRDGHADDAELDQPGPAVEALPQRLVEGAAQPAVGERGPPPGRRGPPAPPPARAAPP